MGEEEKRKKKGDQAKRYGTTNLEYMELGFLVWILGFVG